MGFEPTTPTLARLCSTPELHPRSRPTLALLPKPSGSRLKALSGVVVDRPGDVHSTRCRPSRLRNRTRIRDLSSPPRKKPRANVADRETLFARLEALGIASTTVEHEAMFTVEQSQSLRESLPGAHTKNLFVVDKDRRARARCRQGRRARRFEVGVEAPRLWPPLLREARASPRSARRDPRLGDAVRPDQRSRGPRRRGGGCGLLDFDEVNVHPLDNTATTRLATADLLRLVKASGHEPRIIPLS